MGKMPTKMVGGAAMLALLIPTLGSLEGKRNDPYQDIVKVWTVCYGETNVKMRHYTDAECDDMLRKAGGKWGDDVLKVNPNLYEYAPQWAAATSLAYNIGMGAYKKSTVSARFKKGDFYGACQAISMWNKAGGKVNQGLINRRKVETSLCFQNF